ncbi:MAG TPA: hypothetical protein VFD32_04870, partial [Dehalococcoidia bacterium]|nr:hypothetical protein [Dehalococcoidia bacterium]
MTVSVRGIERELRRRLRESGHAELAASAVEGVTLTDDGSTVYVHIFMRPDWPQFREGDAYPLAFADHPELQSLAAWRALLREAQLLLRDDFPRIVQWLEGR